MCHKLGLQLVVHVPDEGVEASILVETVAEQSASRIEEVVVVIRLIDTEMSPKDVETNPSVTVSGAGEVSESGHQSRLDQKYLFKLDDTNRVIQRSQAVVTHHLYDPIHGPMIDALDCATQP